MAAGNDMKQELPMSMSIPFQLALVTNVDVVSSADDDDGSFNRRGIAISVIDVQLEIGLEHRKQKCNQFDIIEESGISTRNLSQVSLNLFLG
ncbi:MAG: hypothetical protein BGO25_03525 [Acidobacteriales bacterium 59-55]|nr:MAG: hypothetical protein BGO25_03525 [Acidobacteriales bacterium 59-55]